MLGELRIERKGQQTGCPFLNLIQGTSREQKKGRGEEVAQWRNQLGGEKKCYKTKKNRSKTKTVL